MAEALPRSQLDTSERMGWRRAIGTPQHRALRQSPLSFDVPRKLSFGVAITSRCHRVVAGLHG